MRIVGLLSKSTSTYMHPKAVGSFRSSTGDGPNYKPFVLVIFILFNHDGRLEF